MQGTPRQDRHATAESGRPAAVPRVLALASTSPWQRERTPDTLISEVLSAFRHGGGLVRLASPRNFLIWYSCIAHGDVPGLVVLPNLDCGLTAPEWDAIACHLVAAATPAETEPGADTFPRPQPEEIGPILAKIRNALAGSWVRE